MNIKLLLKTSSVSILGCLVDICTLFLLHKYSPISVTSQLYISSILRIIVLFIGHSLYTFKGYSGNFISKCIKFFAWEISFMILIVNIVIFIKNMIYNYLKDKTDKEINNSWYHIFIHRNYLINKKEKHKDNIIGKSKDEIKTYLKNNNYKDKTIDTIIEDIDEDGDGIITYLEYTKYNKNKYILDSYTIVVLKQLVTVILFLLLDIPVYKRIFKK